MHTLSASDDAEVVKFRGATYDAAVEAAEKALGPRVKVVAADRIRRGGIGGFFATELGVEVSVSLHDETVDQALERLVAATAEEESNNWFEQLTSMSHSPIPATIPTTVAAMAAAPAPAAPAPAMVATPPPVIVAEPAPAPVPTAITATGPTMRQLLTARAVVGADTIVSHVAIDSPPSPAEPVIDRAVVVPDQVEMPREISCEPPPTATSEPAAAAPQPAPARRRILLPTRGHVDLAVSAAAELARLTSEQLHGKRISVHVVVTSDDGRSVEADAIIEERS